MLPFGVTIPATVPQGSEIPEGLMNNLVYLSETNTDFRGQIFAGSEYRIYLSLKEMRVE
jgi:hypothetical protein